MNMSNVLHRRSRPTGALRPRIPSDRSLPPSIDPPERETAPPPWPTGAKVLVAILIVAAVLGTIGTALALASSDDGATERLLEDRVAALTQERDEALASADRLDAELATLREQLQVARTGNDELTDRIADLEARIATVTQERTEAVAAADALTAEVADLEATIVDLEASIDGLETSIDGLDAGLKSANQRAAAAIAERDALAKLFPTSFDASLVDVDMVGGYDATIAQVHCTGLTTCGKAPAIGKPTISRTSQGALWLKLPGYVEGGLSRTGGALHMVAHSTTAIPQCAGVARQAEVTMTLFPGGYRINDEGVRSVTSIGGVMTVEAPAVGGCPATLAYYSVELM